MFTQKEKDLYNAIKIGDLYEYVSVYKYPWSAEKDGEIVLVVNKLKNNKELDIVYLLGKELYRTPLDSFITHYRKIA